MILCCGCCVIHFSDAIGVGRTGRGCVAAGAEIADTGAREEAMSIRILTGVDDT